MDEMHEVEPLHLGLVVSFVFLGPDPWLITEILWLLMAVGFYFTTPGLADMPAQEGIGGQAT